MWCLGWRIDGQNFDMSTGGRQMWVRIIYIGVAIFDKGLLEFFFVCVGRGHDICW